MQAFIYKHPRLLDMNMESNDFDVFGWSSVGQKSIQYKVYVKTDEIIANKKLFSSGTFFGVDLIYLKEDKTKIKFE
jgi:hypothetical protein